MTEVPVSARWLSGLGGVAFLLPVAAVVDEFGTAGAVLYVPGLLCAVACAVPAFFRSRERFRTACAAAGMAVAAVSIPAGLIGVLYGLAIGRWTLYLAFLALPVAAVAGLVAGFRRARGRGCGRWAAMVARACAAVTVIGWGAVDAWVFPV
ncbi:hypothetical protein AB0D10_17170 [Kitasatospora sp. NPDC048545]|uniref:hypothetical protein n=1 Tax=Kitasatospora sp. NPDC048545 TaxID=3157208 RepID=UPI0033FFB6B8